ncbi:MAG: zinc ribbon domain-containing protein [Candidatus Aerophobetes bacterium]|nr:zinc ribbon domain-containing protein [Candidatus Aerophobetes bacterium]
MGIRGGRETRNYPKSSSEVFSAITRALKDLKIGAIDKDEKAGTIIAATGFSLFSTGGNVSIEVKPVPDTKETAVTISIEPKMKTVLTDWGQASREVRRIFSKMEEHLGIGPAEAVGEVKEKMGGGKVKQSNTCPSCGQRVGATDKFCQHCGAKLK